MPVSRFAFTAATVTVICGCAAPLPPLAWSKSGATFQEYTADRVQCLRQAQKTVADTVVSGASLVASRSQCADGHLYAACLKDHG